MSAHLTFKELPKVNDCKSCQGTGIVRWYDLDGGPYYSWMKPKNKPCVECKGQSKCGLKQISMLGQTLNMDGS